MADSGVRIQQKGQVTIPYRIRKKLNLKRGDLVVFVETDSGVMIKPASLIAMDAKREEVKAIVQSIRERFKDYSANEIETLVNNAIREVGEKHP
jgi:AbrB family looped-hinge helix DNA binding protein